MAGSLVVACRPAEAAEMVAAVRKGLVEGRDITYSAQQNTVILYHGIW